VAITVAYYSLTGNNEALANHLAEKLRCGLLRITETSPRTTLKTTFDLLFGRLPRIERTDTSLDAYDHVVMVAPVWASKLASPLGSFIARERHQLPEYSFITLAGYERLGQAEKLMQELSRRVGRRPRAFCELIASELVAPESRQRIGVGTPYRVRPEELERYDEAIDDFLRAAGFEIKRWQVAAR
jgi:menaquinone-dependent protoporphyrinogen IX oxidase